MKAILLPEGKQHIAKILSGVDAPINGMYVGYSTKTDTEARITDISYFEALSKERSSGYARIRVTNSTVKEDGTIVFTALFTPADCIGAAPTKNSSVFTATLAHLSENIDDDVFIYSTVLQTPVKIIDGAYITINISMRIGA